MQTVHPTPWFTGEADSPKIRRKIHPRQTAISGEPEPHPTEIFSSFCFRKLGCIAKEGLGVVEWLGKPLVTLFGSGLCCAVASKTHLFALKMATTTAGSKQPPPLNQACLI